MSLSKVRYTYDDAEVCEFVREGKAPDPDRIARYRDKDLLPAGNVRSAIAKDVSGRSREFLLDPSLSVIATDDAISAEECGPSDLVEYQFEDGIWRVATCMKETLQSYMDYLFKAWRDRLEKPSCEAEFRRMLQIGLVTRIYDRMLFPTPPELEGKYVVTDEKTGKDLKLPHQVSGLRVWDADVEDYRVLEPRLKGAPSVEEEGKYWEDLLADFKDRKGQEYIEGMLRG